MIELYLDGNLVQGYMPLFRNKDIIVAIDSSKTNSAIQIADANFHILHDLEIRGGGSDTDVLDLCAVARNNLKLLFEGAHVCLGGIEDIITKQEKAYRGKDTPMDIHYSRYVITTVYNNFLFFFEEYLGVRLIRVNNNSWKEAVLPEEYRKRTHHKGSKDWLMDLGHPLGTRADDITDAFCILQYLGLMSSQSIVKSTPTITDYSPCTMPYNYYLVKGLGDLKVTEVNVNLEQPLQHILLAAAKWGKEHDTDVGIKIPIDLVSIEDIYSTKLKPYPDQAFDTLTDYLYYVVIPG